MRAVFLFAMLPMLGCAAPETVELSSQDPEPALRAAAIHAVQRDAGPRYYFAPDGDGMRATMTGFAVRADADGVSLRRDGRDVDDGRIALAELRCGGEARPRASRAVPEARANAVSFARGSVEEWYLSGPLGLEQGFTLTSPPCESDEFVLTLQTDGLEARPAGEDAIDLLAGGEPAYRYGELFAIDADETPLASAMRVVDGRIELRVAAHDAEYPIVIDPLVVVSAQTLVASDAALNDQFGAAIAVSGDTAWIGAPYDDNAGGTDAGAVYVFVRGATGWTQQSKLLASDGAPNDHFGQAVALDGDTAVVGAYHDDIAALADAGSAYVFVRSGTTWTQQSKLIASDRAAGDQLGLAVALDGDTALLGAHGDNTAAGADAGSAYVFVRSGSSWTQQSKLVAGDGAASDRLGWSVALDADRALVGAMHDDTAAGADAGSAYVFVRSGTTWSQSAKLVAATNASADDIFGWAVALDGDTALVGAPLDDEGATVNVGSAYLFVEGVGGWAQQTRIVTPKGRLGGLAVALEGDVALVGAPQEPGTPVVSAWVHMFSRSGTTWTHDVEIANPAGGFFDFFGLYLDLDGDRAIVGAPYGFYGQAYAYAVRKTNGMACAGDAECISSVCTSGACASGRIESLGFSFEAADFVSPGDGGIFPDGAFDDSVMHLNVTGAVKNLRLVLIDTFGDVVSGIVWDTYAGTANIPLAMQAGYTTGSQTWMLGVWEGTTPRIQPDGSLAPLAAGPHALTLYAAEGIYYQGQRVRVDAELTDETIVSSPVLGYAPISLNSFASAPADGATPGDTGVTPDGVFDDFELHVTVHGAVKNVRVVPTDWSGVPLPGVVWDTYAGPVWIPAPMQNGFVSGDGTWAVSVHENGSLTSLLDGSLPQLPDGVHELTLYGASGWNYQGSFLRVDAELQNGTILQSPVVQYTP